MSVGSGPFPEPGIGWEAGYFASYYGGARLIAELNSIPSNLDALRADLSLASPDAVLIWETDQATWDLIGQSLGSEYPRQEKITDSQIGEVGLILYRSP